jgi:phage FluMu protein Com
METVQLQCGHCKQLMAIGVEHLGAQVQCPHCKGVVQTPARTAPPEPPTVALSAAPNMELTQRESIFGGAESSDAVIGETTAPQVEMPTAGYSAAGPFGATGVADASSPEPDADLTKFKRRPVYDKSVVGLYALIFLIPYSILTTLAILYLLFMQGASRPHPLDMLPDPVPGNKTGGPKNVLRVIHTYPLAEHQKTKIGESIRVGKDGDLTVTPERLLLTEEGDLKLFIRAKNTSKHTLFEPINEYYVKPNKAGTEPYSYLESKSQMVRNIYNSFLEYHKTARNEEAGKAALSPGEETTIVLTTGFEYRKEVAAVAKNADSYTWRVQLRRGFVKKGDKDVSATAVIGVDFTNAQIEREGKKS